MPADYNEQKGLQAPDCLFAKGYWFSVSTCRGFGELAEMDWLYSSTVLPLSEVRHAMS
ncbi:MAG: hypothetical protein WCA07_00685 [Gloeobacterales cyanobacterium]